MTFNALIVSALFSALHIWRFNTGAEADVTVHLNGTINVFPLSWLQTAVAAMVWCWAVTAGIAINEGRSRPLLRAWRAFPVIVTWFAILCAVLILSVLLGTNVAVGVAMVAAPVLARLILAPAAAVLEEKRGVEAFRRAWQLSKGSTLRVLVMVALGVALPALLAKWTFGSLKEVSDGGDWLLLNLTQDLALVTVATLQAIVLANTHGGLAGTPSEQPAEPRVSPAWLAVVLMFTGLPTVLLATTPLGPPNTATHEIGESNVLAAAWPLDKHPIIVTAFGIYDCLDDTCSDTDVTAFAGSVDRGASQVAIAPDGAVYALMYGRIEFCSAHRVCHRAEEQGLPFLAETNATAITLSTYGELIVARAMPVTNPAAPATKLTELSLVHCRDVFCKQPRISVLGRVPAPAGRSYSSGRDALTVTTGRFARPIVTWRPWPVSSTVHFGWCDTIECSNPGVATGLPNGPADSFDAAERAALTSRAGCESGSCDSLGWAGWAGTRGYKAVAEQFTKAGSPLQRLVLLDCPDLECANPTRRLRIGELTGTQLPLALAASADGRVVTFTQGKIIIVTP